MFSKLGSLASLAKQASEMQGRMAEVQENLKRLKVAGSAGAGMVTVEVNGQLQVLACKVDPSLFKTGDREMLEDLVTAATNQALDKAREAAAAEMAKVTDGIDLSSFRETLSKLGLGSS